MKMPRSILVEGVRYSVVGLTREDAHKDLRGIIYFENEGQTIMVEGRLGSRQKALTLLHEVLHAALIPLKLNTRKEEVLVLRLEQGLASVFENNPTAMKCIIDALRSTRPHKSSE